MQALSKGEDLVNSILLRENIPFVREKTFKELKSAVNSTLLPVDFALNIQGYQAIIEYNGYQHYQPTSGTPEAVDAWNRLSKNGQNRINFAKFYNVPLLVIHYNDYEQVNSIVLKFIDDVKLAVHGKNVKYTKNSKGYFAGYPYRRASDKGMITNTNPIEAVKNENNVYSVLANSIIMPKNIFETMKNKAKDNDEKIKKYQAVVGDCVLRISNLEDNVEGLQEENEQLRAILNEKQQEIADQTKSEEFIGKFRENQSVRAKLTQEAKDFIQRLADKFENDWQSIQNFLNINYDENVSITTIKRVCDSKEN